MLTHIEQHNSRRFLTGKDGRGVQTLKHNPLTFHSSTLGLVREVTALSHALRRAPGRGLNRGGEATGGMLRRRAA